MRNVGFKHSFGSGDATELCEAAMNCSSPVEAAQIMAQATAISRTGRLRDRIAGLLAERAPQIALGTIGTLAEAL